MVILLCYYEVVQVLFEQWIDRHDGSALGPFSFRVCLFLLALALQLRWGRGREIFGRSQRKKDENVCVCVGGEGGKVRRGVVYVYR